MLLSRGKFEQSDIEMYGTGAGIIPVSESPTGELHLLLGRERFMPAWKGSCRWSGFEGSRKPNESLLETAVREFDEESLGVIFPDKEEVQDILTDKDYMFRVVLRISNERRSERYHSTYVISVPWDANIGNQFASRRSEIEFLDHLRTEMDNLFPSFILSDNSPIEIGDITIENDGSVKIERYVVNADYENSLFFVKDPGDGHTDDEDEDVNDIVWTREEKLENLAHRERTTLQSNHPYVVRLCKWEQVRSKFERMTINHRSVVTRYGPISGRLQEANVLTDHLEKDQLRWWSTTDLRRVLDMRGFLGNDCFRPYFLPVLQTVLHELS